MAKYDEIWHHLIKHRTVTLAIAKTLQPRVIKGVIHAKDHDLLRKLELSEKRKFEQIEYVSESSRVIINLITYDNLKDIKLEEL